ncbi:MAG: hypothetical protein DHS20C08_06980 [Rhodomicrobium sp.]|nr:MAG: hypothetical protein DHS20C08_06980 [Rhodomicrobium sp.]
MFHFTTAPSHKAGQPTRHIATVSLSAITGLLALSALASPHISTQAQAADAGHTVKHVQGIWRTHNGELIRFTACGPQICGKLLSTRSGISKDKNNPNPKLRNRPVKGLTIIRSHKKTGPSKWIGTVYSIKDGRKYRGSLKLTGARSAKLTGCDGAFCQSATWTKISKTRIANK